MVRSNREDFKTQKNELNRRKAKSLKPANAGFLFSKEVISMATQAAKQVSVLEAELVTQFSNQVNAIQFNKGMTLENLVLTYNRETGFSILIEEAPTPTEAL